MSSNRAKAHARHSRTCPCGRTVWGNGGWASHRRACRIYNLHHAESLRRLIAEYEERDSPVYAEYAARRRLDLAEVEAHIAAKGWTDDG